MKVKSTGKWLKNSINGVIGIDEVGRGPFAGPVTVCAIYLEDPKTVKRDLFGSTIRDSKKLSKDNRSKIHQTIKKYRYLDNNIIYSVSSRSAIHIDKNGINKSIQDCLKSCILKLRKSGVNIQKVKINLDGGLIIPIKGLKQKSFIKGDEKYTEIALASIMAKMHRDKIMVDLSTDYIEYNWQKNMGYGTKEHIFAIKKCGITKYHRKSFLKRILTTKPPQ